MDTLYSGFSINKIAMGFCLIPLRLKSTFLSSWVLTFLLRQQSSDLSREHDLCLSASFPS